MRLSEKIICAIPSLKDRFQPEEPVNQLLVELAKVQMMLMQAQQEFDRQTNLDLIESCIYQIESLEVRYNYLIKQARKAGISHSELLNAKLLQSVC